MDRLRLTHVAVRFGGEIYSLPQPNRHSHVIRTITGADKNIDYMSVYNEGEFGFLDEAGFFLNRKQAAVNAELHGQVKDASKILQGALYSEALW